MVKIMNQEILVESFKAFNTNALNQIVYSISTNWCLIALVIGAIASGIMGIKEQSQSVVREEQNII